MRCLIKLAIAISIAVLTQKTLKIALEPGGPFEEAGFMAQVAVGTNFRGLQLDSPEMIGAAQRLAERRQGFAFHVPNPLDLSPEDGASQSRCSASSNVASADPAASAPAFACEMSTATCAR